MVEADDPHDPVPARVANLHDIEEGKSRPEPSAERQAGGKGRMGTATGCGEDFRAKERIQSREIPEPPPPEPEGSGADGARHLHQGNTKTPPHAGARTARRGEGSTRGAGVH